MRGLKLPLLGEVRFLLGSVGGLMTETRTRYSISALIGRRPFCLEAQMPGAAFCTLSRAPLIFVTGTPKPESWPGTACLTLHPGEMP
jgi:hypothetical protein